MKKLKTSAAINAAKYLRDRQRYERGYAHQRHDVDPQPDADGSTAWLEELSSELRQPLVAHPDRRNVWVRGGDAA